MGDRAMTTTANRRAVIAGLGASCLWPSLAGAQADGTLAAALDRAAALPPAEALAGLRAYNAGALPPARALDLVTARAGLGIDAQLAALPQAGDRKSGYRPRPDAGAITPAHYALLLARPLGRVDPRRAQRRLSRELDALHARAARLFAAIGMTQGTIGDRYVALWQDDRFLYADPQAAVADMTRSLAAARLRVPATIGPVPAWCIDVTVRSLSPADIAAGRGGYRVVPTPTQQGAYVVDLKQLRRRPSWTLPSVVAHELLPGHMIQLGLEGLAAPHPLRIDYAASFVEGWGIYAETLAAADGAFPDPRVALGHLHWLIFRVARALADLGIHLDRWSLDAARARLVAWQGEPAYFAPFETELPRIAREPASRVAEAMAWLAIRDAVGTRSGRRRIAVHRRLLDHGRMRVEQIGNAL